MRMKRLMSAFLALVMVMSMVTVPASAEDTISCTKTTGCTLAEDHTGECSVPTEPSTEPVTEPVTEPQVTTYCDNESCLLHKTEAHTVCRYCDNEKCTLQGEAHTQCQVPQETTAPSEPTCTCADKCVIDAKNAECEACKDATADTLSTVCTGKEPVYEDCDAEGCDQVKGHDGDHTGAGNFVECDGAATPGECNADTHVIGCSKVVATIGDITYTDLASAVGAANAGETIVLYKDVDKLPTIGKAITVKGANTTAPYINVAGGAGENQFGAIDGTVTLQYLNFVNGTEAIRTDYTSADYSKLTLQLLNCNFNNLTGYAVMGGAATASGNHVLNKLVVDKCTFNASTTTYGNNYMVYAQCVQNLTITNNTFNGNNNYKGAIHTGDATDVATVATVYGNIIKGFARGVQVANRAEGSSVSVDKNSFENIAATTNESKSGAIYIHGNADSDANVSIINNTANQCDVLLYNDDNTTTGDTIPDIVDTFTNNTLNGVAYNLNENGEILPDPVAQVGEQKYATVEAALEAVTADNNVITLLRDVESLPTITKPVTIQGQSAANKATISMGVGGDKPFAEIEGQVTFKNLIFDASGTTPIRTDTTNIDHTQMTLILDGCEFTNVGAYSAIRSGSTGNTPFPTVGRLVVTGCTFTGAGTNNGNFFIDAQCTKVIEVRNSTFDGNGVVEGAVNLGVTTSVPTIATIGGTGAGNTIKDVAVGVQVGQRVDGSKINIDSNTFENVTSAPVSIYILAEPGAIDEFKVTNNNFNSSATAIFTWAEKGVDWNGDADKDGDEQYATDFNITFTGNKKDGVDCGDLDGDYAPTPVYVAQVGTGETAQRFQTIQAAVDAAGQNDTITLIADEEISLDKSETIEVAKKVTIDLNGKTINAGGDAFTVVAGGDLTINGNGTVKAGTAADGSYCAVWTNGGGKVTINGGTYSVGAKSGDYNDLIYAKGGSITITGGYFNSENTQWSNNGKYYVLNQNNTNPGTITVSGGTFENYDPAEGDDSVEDDTFLASGFCSAAKDDGKTYTVAQHKLVHVPAVKATCQSDGNIEHYKCANCGKLYDAAQNGKELTGKDVVIAGGKHDLEYQGGKLATYDADGIKEHYYCEIEDCGEKFEDAKGEVSFEGSTVIEMLSHVEGNVLVIDPEAIENEGKKNVVLDLTQKVVMGSLKEVVEVEFQTACLEDHVDRDGTLRVVMSDGEVYFDNDALATIVDAAEGATVTLVVDEITKTDSGLTAKQKTTLNGKKDPYIIRLQLWSNGKRITDDFDGKVYVYLTGFEPKTGYKASSYSAFFLDEDGTTDSVSYYSRDVRLTVEHFSEYFLARNAKAASNAATGDTSNVLVWGGVGLAAVAALVVLLILNRKKKGE